MKIIFAGTPAFAAEALVALIHSSHDIVAVYTQPDRPAGRGLALTESAVKTVALENHLPLYQPISLKSTEEQALLASHGAEVMVVAAYGLLLPKPVLDIPPLGCVNIHPSLLPRWRGAAPIQRTLHAGDTITGVTIMQMDEGLDTGPMLLQRTCPLAAGETSQTLHDKLATLGATLLLETLTLLEADKLTPVIQDEALATYAQKIKKEEACIDWRQPAKTIMQMVCAFHPWPVAYTAFEGQTLRVWEATVIDSSSEMAPGALVKASEAGIDVATGRGVLRLLRVQLPGAKVISAADFYHAKGHLLMPGVSFT
ncbi:MAG TPA: methionyl-tRNA formyltransferase [Gammaproteobacteria bacterium]|jgi:methionyl-tRNA formyltransferase|nr:methionyl-tRNA formyltransferase [Gammaproteobacteria bacterium]